MTKSIYLSCYILYECVVLVFDSRTIHYPSREKKAKIHYFRTIVLFFPQEKLFGLVKNYEKGFIMPYNLFHNLVLYLMQTVLQKKNINTFRCYFSKCIVEICSKQLFKYLYLSPLFNFKCIIVYYVTMRFCSSLLIYLYL